MKRKILSVLMIVMLLCSNMTITTFAETTEDKPLKEQIPEAVVLVQVNNAECKMIEKMTDLTVDIKLKDGRDVINVPVERVEEEGEDLVALWLGYSFDEIDAQIKADMAEFQKNYHLGNAEDFMMNALSLMLGIDDMSKDLLSIFENYEIVINGIPEDADHEFEIETNTMLITSTIVSELFDIAAELVGTLLELSKEEIAKINSFSDIIALLNDMLVEYELIEKGQDIYDFVLDTAETNEITKAELVTAVAEMDAVLDYLRSEEYTGTVFAGVYMDCECPYTVSYRVYHQYFKEIDGRMVLAGTENFGPEKLSEELEDDELYFMNAWYEGMSGDLIKATDYIHTEFNGETYTYKGSYGEFSIIYPEELDPLYMTTNHTFDSLDELYACDEWWKEDKCDEFVLGTEEPMENSLFVPTGLVLRYELLEESDITPETGDDSNMTPFYLIMMLAVAVMAMAVVTRRKQKI